MYGEDFYELTGRHRDGCPIGGILVDAKVSEEEKKCPVCGCELKLGSYRELIDVRKADEEIDEMERKADEAQSDLADVKDRLDEVEARLEDRDAEIENMSEIISGLESERDELRAELEARE